MAYKPWTVIGPDLWIAPITSQHHQIGGRYWLQSLRPHLTGLERMLCQYKWALPATLAPSAFVLHQCISRCTVLHPHGYLGKGPHASGCDCCWGGPQLPG